MNLAAIILAAGHGTRMKSRLPKVLHPLMGKPMIQYALDAVKPLGAQSPIVVVGHGSAQVREYLLDQAQIAIQTEQLGTGHAVSSALPQLTQSTDTVVVTFADMPLLTHQTLAQLVDLHLKSQAKLSMTSIIGNDPRGFGRVARDADGNITGIVEEVDATPDQLQIKEYNVSAYCFDAGWLRGALLKIQPSPKGEYYLTDLVGIAAAEGLFIQSLVLDDVDEGMGVNTRVHLAEASKALRKRINQAHMLSGVTLIDPDSTYIEPGVCIGQDTTLYPNTSLYGRTIIGEDCIIGPNTMITDTMIGNHCTLLASVLEYATLEDDVSMGPFCHLRKGAYLSKGVHMGNFGEVKDSTLGERTKMGHFSYIGNAQIASDVNIGAGTITCNYDGENKNKTIIGENAFIGSDTMLVAPVTIGRNARTGAGSVVTRDVPDDTIVFGVPAHIHKGMEKSD